MPFRKAKKTISLYIVFFGLFFPTHLFAQGEIDDQEKIFYRNEKTYAFGLNSNGASFHYRYGVRVNAFRHRVYELDIANLKHPKELKISNPYPVYYTSGRFVYGKLNAFIVARADYGYQKEIYQKRDIGGLSIRRNYSIGASLGILKPIYYEVVIPSTLEVEDQKFDPVLHTVIDILGPSSFFKGISEILPDPGIHAKYSYSFEYSKKDETLRMLESGVMAEYFLYPPKIMAITTNSPFFLTLFVQYRFGKVVDSRYSKKMKEISLPVIQ